MAKQLPKYIKHAKVTFGEVAIANKNAVSINITPQFKEITLKHDFGDTPIEKVLTGYTGTIEVEVGEDTLETFKMTLPTDVAEGLGNESTLVDQAMGTLVEGKEVKIDIVGGGEDDQIGFFKAIPTGTYSRTFGDVSYNKIIFEMSVKDDADPTKQGNFFWRGKKPTE